VNYVQLHIVFQTPSPQSLEEIDSIMEQTMLQDDHSSEWRARKSIHNEFGYSRVLFNIRYFLCARS
jgi:hypothetical protein